MKTDDVPEPDPDLEQDSRFPSGPWKGFFLQPVLPGRHWMELNLTFRRGSSAARAATGSARSSSGAATRSRPASAGGPSSTSAGTRSTTRATTRARASGGPGSGSSRPAGTAGSTSGPWRWATPPSNASPRRLEEPAAVEAEALAVSGAEAA